MKNTKQTKTLGLALGSGGWRGLAHIGIIKELHKNGFKIDYIAGSSAGALIGGLYAALDDINTVERILKENLSNRRMLYALSDPQPRQGLFRGNKFKSILDSYLSNQKIEKCPIPFCAITTDLITGKTIELNKGSLSKAIRASISIPFVFQPVTWGKMRLIDGGTSVPIPCKTVRQMGADVVLAVNLQKNQFPMTSTKPNTLKTTLKTAQVMLYHLSQYSQKAADLVLFPDIQESESQINPYLKLENRDDVLEAGEKIVQENLSKIKQLLS